MTDILCFPPLHRKLKGQAMFHMNTCGSRLGLRAAGRHIQDAATDAAAEALLEGLELGGGHARDGEQDARLAQQVLDEGADHKPHDAANPCDAEARSSAEKYRVEGEQQ